MKATYTVFAADGSMQRRGSCPPSALVHIEAALNAGEFLVETTDTPLEDADVYWDGSQAQLFPPQPSRWHTWSQVTKSWEPQLALAKEFQKDQTNKERVRRSVLPLTYDSKRLDADEVAQQNLAAKLLGVQQRIRLGRPTDAAQRVWRDADNNIHSWPSAALYFDWLAGFAIALEERNTALYVKMWEHKAAIEALSDVNAVLAYDVTAGWPS